MTPGFHYQCHVQHIGNDARPCGYDDKGRDQFCVGCARSGQGDRAAELAEALSSVQESWDKRWGIPAAAACEPAAAGDEIG